jgi:hypothetical protein
LADKATIMSRTTAVQECRPEPTEMGGMTDSEITALLQRLQEEFRERKREQERAEKKRPKQ